MGLLDAVKANADLVNKIGLSNAYFVWAIAIYLEAPDVTELAAAALTDGSNDKKIDFIYLDNDSRRIIFAQGYFSEKPKEAAPSDKASDLNTACAWLLSGELTSVPVKLRAIIADCREAIAANDVEGIDLLYVHNLPESVNIARELQTVSDHFKLALGDSPIAVRATELGGSRIDHLFDAQESHISIKDSVPFPADIVFAEQGADWKASVASVDGSWLHILYAKYGDDLFSANYRGFLGISKGVGLTRVSVNRRRLRHPISGLSTTESQF